MSCLPDSLSSIILGICTLEQAIFSSRLSMFHLEKITLHQSAQLGVLDGSVGSILSQARLATGVSIWAREFCKLACLPGQGLN